MLSSASLPTWLWKQYSYRTQQHINNLMFTFSALNIIFMSTGAVLTWNPALHLETSMCSSFLLQQSLLDIFPSCFYVLWWAVRFGIPGAVKLEIQHVVGELPGAEMSCRFENSYELPDFTCGLPAGYLWSSICILDLCFKWDSTKTYALKR